MMQLVLSLVLAAAESEPAATFAWPVPSEAQVVESIDRGGERVEVRYRLVLEAGPQPGEYIWSMHDAEYVERPATVVVSSLIMPPEQQPALRVRADGVVAGLVDPGIVDRSLADAGLAADPGARRWLGTMIAKRFDDTVVQMADMPREGRAKTVDGELPLSFGEPVKARTKIEHRGESPLGKGIVRYVTTTKAIRVPAMISDYAQSSTLDVERGTGRPVSIEHRRRVTGPDGTASMEAVERYRFTWRRDAGDATR